MLSQFRKAKDDEPFSVDRFASANSVKPAAPAVVQKPAELPASRNIAASRGSESQAGVAPTGAGLGQTTYEPPEWAVEPHPGVWWLEVRKEGVQAEIDRVPLERKCTVFGRVAPACHAVLEHPSISRQHAALVLHKNGSSDEEDDDRLDNGDGLPKRRANFYRHQQLRSNRRRIQSVAHANPSADISDSLDESSTDFESCRDSDAGTQAHIDRRGQVGALSRALSRSHSDHSREGSIGLPPLPPTTLSLTSESAKAHAEDSKPSFHLTQVGHSPNQVVPSLQPQPEAVYAREGHLDSKEQATVAEVAVEDDNGQLWVPPPAEEEEEEAEVDLAAEAEAVDGGWSDDEAEDDDWEGDFSPRRERSAWRKTAPRKNGRTVALESHKRALRSVVDAHFKALVAQLLASEQLDVVGEGGGGKQQQPGWLEIVSALALKAASLVKPDTSKGGAMDPGGYVKVKCVASGERSDSCVVKGVVCRKNVAHRRMVSRHKAPRLLMLAGGLEYQRVSHQLSSLDTLLQEEKDHLSLAVQRIEAHKPDVLLVEKTVSRYAQDRLLAREISLVLNIKPQLMERIARCTGAEIVASTDNLAAPRIGHCELFHVERFVEEHGSAGADGKKNAKTLMFFEGCPRPLGCTVLLRGGPGNELKRVKRVVQFAVYAAYHLALETSFLADEGATLPDTFPDFEFPKPNQALLSRSPDYTSTGGSGMDALFMASPGYCGRQGLSGGELTDCHLPILSVSPCVTFPPREDPDSPGAHRWPGVGSAASSSEAACTAPSLSPSLATSPSNLSMSGLEQPQASGSAVVAESGETAASTAKQPVRLMENGPLPLTPVASVSQLSGLSSATEAFHAPPSDPGAAPLQFCPSPSEHQSILVSLSSRCVTKGTVCDRPHLVRIKYYGSTDMPLGKFLLHGLFNTKHRCPRCGESSDAHVRCYTHREGSLTISVRRLKPDQLLSGGSEGRIWMWHRCLRCKREQGVPPATKRVLMSDAAAGLSFGKFLELSFSNHAAASRAAACGHSLHYDCLRFYGCGGLVGCFHYSPIHLLSVHIPEPRLLFNEAGQQQWLLEEVTDLTDRTELVFAEVLDTLRVMGERISGAAVPTTFGGGRVAASEARRRIVELEALVCKEKAAFEAELLLATQGLGREKGLEGLLPGEPLPDVLELNRVRRNLLRLSLQWDSRLHFLASSLKVQKVPTLAIEGLYDGGAQEKEPRPFQGQFPEPGLSSAPGSNTPKVPSGERADSSGEAGLPSADPGFLVGSLGIWESPAGLQLPVPLERTVSVSTGVQTSPALGFAESAPEGAVPAGDGSEAKEEGSSEDPVEGGIGVRRVLSEGHLPILADLSDTLEAAWTGGSGQPTLPAMVMALAGQEGAREQGAQAEEGPAGSAVRSQAVASEACTTSSREPGESVGGTSQAPASEQGSDAANTPAALQPGVASPEDPPPSAVLDAEVHPKPGLVLTVSEEFPNHSGTASTPQSPTRLGRLASSGNLLGALAGSSPTAFVPHAAEAALQGGGRLSLPPGVNDAVVAVYDDEPTSVIAYGLLSEEYDKRFRGIPCAPEGARKGGYLSGGSSSADLATADDAPEVPGVGPVPRSLPDGPLAGDGGGVRGGEAGPSGQGGKAQDPLLSPEPFHVKLSFTDDSPQGKARFSVVAYYCRQFEALRRRCCGGDGDFLRSLCRCKKWNSYGGRSNVYFAKTADDRFVVKQVTRTELLSFLEFAPDYFKYLSEALTTGAPTCLAKILGVYQVSVKHAKGGKESRMDLVVMENLLYGHKISRIYDLKGSVRSRYNPDCTGKNKVLLDENLLEAMPTAPIFVGNKAKRLLERAVWNDTAFLAGVYVMDYSLLVGVDEERQELVLGIIDFIRQYTWDKHLETWVKASGILGGPKNAAPTVISPKQYKKRFRKAMSTYFVMVPDQWTPPAAPPTPEGKDEDEVGERATVGMGDHDPGAWESGPQGIASHQHPVK